MFTVYMRVYAASRGRLKTTAQQWQVRMSKALQHKDIPMLSTCAILTSIAYRFPGIFTAGPIIK